MEAELKRQKQLAEGILQLYSNYKKDSAHRKTVEYLNKKFENLEELWVEFDELNNKLKEHEDPEQPYFAQKTYEAVKKVYDEFIANILTKLQETDANRQKDQVAIQRQLKVLKLHTQNLEKMLCLIEGTNIVEQSPGCCEIQANSLEKLWNDWNKKYFEIQLNTEDDTEYKEIDYNNFYIRYSSVVGTLKDCIKKANPTTVATTSEKTNSPDLPKIKIPEFDGKLASWKIFHELYKQIVHNNATLGDGAKMQYLKTFIKGDAAKLINHLSPTGDNYESAYTLLVNRYDNTRLLLGKLLDNIIELPQLSTESCNGLKTMHDTTWECLLGIKNLKINTDNWDPLITHLLHKKFDKETRKHYECQLANAREPQKIKDLLKYMEGRFTALEASEHKQNKSFTEANKNHAKNNNNNNNNNTQKKSCIYCKKQHKIVQCSEFIKMEVQERNNWIKTNKRCLNCFSDTHKSGECKSIYKCKNCKKNHHTLLHIEDYKNSSKDNKTSTTSAGNKVTACPAVTTVNNDTPSTSTNLHVQALVTNNQIDVILATAIVNVQNVHGSMLMFKALIDQGSQSSFLTENAAQMLALPRTKISAVISGIGEQTKTANHSVQLQISPRYPSDFRLITQAVVLEKLTNVLPRTEICQGTWKHLDKLLLADPTFDGQSKIDILLGAADFAKIIKAGLIKGPINAPIAQNTELGWIISGQATNKDDHKEIKITSLISTAQIDLQLKKFWEINEPVESQNQTTEEEMCEKHFTETYQRLNNGRYMVKLPFKTNTPDLGNSKQLAIATLLQLERKFGKNPQFFEQYKNFINEYIDLNHAKLVLNPHINEENANYLPHHAVFKDSSTTKIRVVFDASRKTSNQKSLNDNLAVGPTLQQDMVSLIMRWRKHHIAFTADIEKMYRQIAINPEHAKYQRIVWRNSPTERIRVYELMTVTYGTSCAPYLAIRTLQQLANDEKQKHPEVAEILLKDFYVDDVLSGADTVEQAKKLQIELKELLQKGGFNLRKWASNSNELIINIPEEDRELKSPQYLNMDNTVKTLGIHWNPITDYFGFKINMALDKNAKTKREMLSEIASLFDPLGWISPIIIKAKVLLQELWVLGTAWDADVPNIINNKWKRIKNELPQIEEIKLTRWLKTNSNSSDVEIHGFCDSSEVAYAAVVYIKCKDENGKTNVTLLAAKTKVAPIKKLSIPRLELCGALLLSKLMKQVINAVDIKQLKVFMWTDSKVVLAWIKGNPKRWKTFVANRTLEISKTVGNKNWYHVSSESNPADCASRGLFPSEIKTHELWWNGPSWLQSNEIAYPTMDNLDTTIEQKPIAVTLTAQIAVNILPACSSYFKLQRVIAYCLRFYNNCKNQHNKQIGPINTYEIQKASVCIIGVIQKEQFHEEIKTLLKGDILHKSSKLINLKPFIDEKGILRVGGRIEHAEINNETKHQIILPHNHEVTKLIINMVHLQTKHGGPKLTEATIRQKYWIVNGYKLIKFVIHKCIICHRYNTKPLQQIMGNLPAARVSVARPFTNTGVDYAGPINVRASKGRGHTSYKGYISLFICLATKAIHVELVSDLTAEAFIAAYKRFTARRGNVANIYSDNGTNFVKANKMLKQKTEQEEEEYNNLIYNELTRLGTQWHFIPPASPHFGGLWEAGVKSIKAHLKKAIGETTLTFEELTTLLYQIEACLNSRPLCPLSTEVNDTEVLTPGHFLIGAPLLAPAEENVLDVKSNRLNRWQLVQKMHQSFWKKWKEEYLTRLQQRAKWTTQKNEPKINDLVLIKDEILPPARWALGRIIDKHPGPDNITRVVTLKTKDNTIKRPITKICPLPLADDDVMENEEKETKKIQVNMATVSRAKPRKGSRIPILFVLLACLVASTLQIPLKTQPLELRPFTHKPGIYFEEMGKAYLSHTNWIIIAFYDMQNFWYELEIIKKGIKNLKNLCEQSLINKKSCMETIEQLNQHRDDLIQKNELINPSDGKRSKRALLDIVGNVASDLFGVLDSRYAREYAQDINKLKGNEEHLLQLLKNQTSIAETTMNVLRKDEDAIFQQFERTNEVIESIRNLSMAEEANHRLDNTALQLLSAMLKYESTQNAILDVILDAHNGRVNPTVITPDQLRQQLGLIQSQIKTSLLVPGDDTHDNLKALYQIMSGKAISINNKILFKISIPLLMNMHFQIFKLISVPTLHQNSYLWIEPSTPFLLVTLKRNYYYSLTENEYQRCIIFINSVHICLRTHQLFNTNSQQHRCDMKLLNHEKQLDKNCQIKTTFIQDVWIPLEHNNEWIYVIHDSYSLDVICGDNIDHVELQGEGILQLRENCIIRHNSMEITSHNKIKTQYSGSVLPILNLTNEIQNYKPMEIKESTYQPTNISTLEDMIRRQRAEENVIETFNGHDIHHYALGYIIVTMLIISLLFLYKKRRVQERCPPSAQPRITRAISMPLF